jgi:hypothetical protein
MIDTRLPRFKIATNVFDAMSFDDMKKTAIDMVELKIYRPPFSSFCIQVKSHCLQTAWVQAKNSKRVHEPKMEFIFNFYLPNLMYYESCEIDFFVSTNGIDFKNLKPENFVNEAEAQQEVEWMATTSMMALIVLLATKNIHKDVETCNKPNSRNRREQTLSKYSSTTTISIGKISQTMRSEGGTGGPVRPHLRRGHIRHQRCGEGRLEVKKIFIQPMFINADQGWIDTQKEYRVTA